MSTIIITGATGFLGNHLTKKFQSEGFDVIPVSRQKVKDYYHVETYHQIPEGDILIHLAGESNRNKANGMGLTYTKSSCRLTKYLCSKSYKYFLYASSSIVYGDEGISPFSEECAVKLGDHYGTSKALNERIVLTSGGAVARLANIYGPGMSAENLFTDILKQIPNTDNLYLKNDTSIRDFIYIEDAVMAIFSLVNSRSKGIFNVGSGQGVSAGEIAKNFLNLACQPARKISISSPNTRQSKCILDISKIFKITGWSPAVKIKDGCTQIFNQTALNV